MTELAMPIPTSDPEKNASVAGNTEESSPEISSDEQGHTTVPEPKPEAVLSSKKALLAWLLLCFSTGPTSTMLNTYVPASIQSMANILGHERGSLRKCKTRGAINCVVKFGSGEIDYNSYVLYLQAIARACEGILTILFSGVADYSNYRKTLMLVSIILFGSLALPFAGLINRTYAVLIVTSVLYCFMNTISSAYAVMESSYIPLFMRSTGLFGSGGRTRIHSAVQSRKRDPAQTRSLIRGARVSVLGLVVGNVGSIMALLIGLIITHVRGQGALNGYRNFLLAITIAGCLTIVFGATGGFLIPSVKGKTRPPTNLLFLSIRRFISLLKSIKKYPEAFKLCIGWILWNTAYSNFNSVMALLFRETLGLGAGDKEYTIWTFTALLFACCGSITWMFTFPHLNIHIKTYAYTFLLTNILCLLWGSIGISPRVPIGYKHRPEFYIEQFLFLSTSSALRSLNRVLYASMLPLGREAQFFGLEITLDLATGWINPLVQGAIQNRTHNLRWPMVPNLGVMLVAAGVYWWVDVEKGMRDALVGDEGVGEGHADEGVAEGNEGKV